MDKSERVFEPTLESLAEHEMPKWWTDAKFGIFIHWGVYAVPAFSPLEGDQPSYSEWYWLKQQIPPELSESYGAGVLAEHVHHRETYGEDFLHDDFIPQWKAERWDPAEWIDLFEAAGAKYFVLVTKHHDGIALWPTETTDRHTVAMGPHRDIVGELVEASRGSGLHAGLYYSLPEWFNPAPRPIDPTYTDVMKQAVFAPSNRPRNAYTGQEVPYTGYRPIADYANDHVIPQIQELIDRYDPSIIWGDISGDAGYYRSNEWIAYYFNRARGTNPDGVVVNDRCGTPAHADHTTVEYHSIDGIEPPFEVCRGMGTSFGYNALETEEHYQSATQLIRELVDVVAHGGNFLLNVGPMADGTIPPPQADRLRAIGAWMDRNGSAIHDSRPWTLAAVDDVRFTVSPDGALNVFFPAWPEGDLVIDAPVRIGPDTTVVLLGGDGTALQARNDGSGRLVVTAPAGGSADHASPMHVLRITGHLD